MLQVSVAHLHAVDKSKYTTKNPPVYGNHPVPRLAQMMEVESLTVRVDNSQIEGLMVSGRLYGASAKGWSGESGNLITRYAWQTADIVLDISMFGMLVDRGWSCAGVLVSGCLHTDTLACARPLEAPLNRFNSHCRSIYCCNVHMSADSSQVVKQEQGAVSCVASSLILL